MAATLAVVSLISSIAKWTPDQGSGPVLQCRCGLGMRQTVFQGRRPLPCQKFEEVAEDHGIIPPMKSWKKKPLSTFCVWWSPQRYLPLLLIMSSRYPVLELTVINVSSCHVKVQPAYTAAVLMLGHVVDWLTIVVKTLFWLANKNCVKLICFYCHNECVSVCMSGMAGSWRDHSTDCQWTVYEAQAAENRHRYAWCLPVQVLSGMHDVFLETFLKILVHNFNVVRFAIVV